MEPIKVDFTKKGKSKVKDILIPPEKAGLKIIINIVITLLVAVLGYYFILPPMNLKATQCYMYFALVFASYIGSAILTTKVMAKPEYIPYVRKQATFPVILLVILGMIFAGGYLSSAVLFRAKSYSSILKIDEKADFSTSVSSIKKVSDFDKVPMIDMDAATGLADKTIGNLRELGLESQFSLAETLSSQINFKGSPYRVYPLQYSDIFKWLNNRKEGLPGYLTVNMNTSNAEFVSTNANGDKVNIKYSPSEHFGRFLMRVLRFEFPTFIFGIPSFEIDEFGNPFWIVERIDKTVGLLGGDDVIGIVMINAVSGEATYYNIDEVHSGLAKDGSNISWIDQVYDANLLIKQYNYKGRFSNGFINAYIGQEGVKITTTGNSYLAINDDVYMYTGVTSANNDRSILGFILINQRTKEANFYGETGATEEAAQGSAEGIVSDKKWKATFPLLLNLDGEPTYFMALKDDNNIVKSYAMVNVNQFSDAVRSPSDDNPNLEECLSAYISKVSSRVKINIDMNSTTGGDSKTEKLTVNGVIEDMRTIVNAGNTIYFVKLTGKAPYFTLNAAENNGIVIKNVGDELSLMVTTIDGQFINAKIFETPAENTTAQETTVNAD